MTPSRPSEATSVLFVCLGNICRSPLAEGIFASIVEARGLGDQFRVDSAGTAGYHVGERADHRSIAVAADHGVRLAGRARQVTDRDVKEPGVVVAMDRSNLRSLERRRGRHGNARLVLMRDYDSGADSLDVPDPYYGGPEGFEEVYRILERSCRALLDELAGPDG